MAERAAVDIQSYLENQTKLLAAQTIDPTVVAAIRGIGLTLKSATTDPLVQMRDAYAKPMDDGKPAVERLKAGSTTYDRMHEQYHPGFVSMMKFHGLPRYIVDDTGRVVYSVTKGDDYAVNLNDDKWAKETLSQLVATLAAKPEPQVLVSDIVPYGAKGPSLFLAAPVVYYNKHIGTIAYRIDAGAIQGSIKTQAGLGKTGEIRIVRKDGTLLSDSRYSTDNDVLSGRLELPAEATNTTETSRFDFNDPLSQTTSVAVTAPIQSGDHGWLILTTQSEDEVFEPLAQLRNSLLLTLSAFLIIGCIVGVYVARSILSPLQLLNKAMERLAQGRFDEDTPGQARRDELGAMARAVEVLRGAALDKARLEQISEETRIVTEKRRADHEEARQAEESRIREAVDALGNGLQRLSEGDLTVSLDTPFMESLDRVRLDFNASIEKLASTLAHIRRGIGSIDANASEMRAAVNSRPNAPNAGGRIGGDLRSTTRDHHSRARNDWPRRKGGKARLRR